MDSLTLLRLSRPAKRNALNERTIRGLQRFFADPPDGIGAVVLHGEGDNFSAGLTHYVTENGRGLAKNIELGRKQDCQQCRND